MIKDWFSHGSGDADDAGRSRSPTTIWPEHPMVIPRTPPTRRGPPARTGTRRRSSTPRPIGGTGRQMYGTTPGAPAEACGRASDGKLQLGPDGLLPRTRTGDGSDPGARVVARPEHARLGCSSLEHNAICDRLKPGLPAWTDEELFQRARLINAAVLAKIHTVEWTPAVISPPDDRGRACARTGTGWPASGSPSVRAPERQRGRQRHPGLARRSTTACRTRSPRSSRRSTGCTR